jgi:N-acetylmuramoyl-L-alanine amidase
MRRDKFTRASGRLRVLLIVASVPVLLGLGCCAVSLRNTISPEGIVIHHSAVPRLPGERAVDATVLEEFHRRRGFGIFYWGRIYHVGYHYVILPDGTVQEGRPVRCRGAHATGYNSYIGICLVGDFSSRGKAPGEQGALGPTVAQLDALGNLCRRLQAEYGIPAEHVVTHREVNPETECPGEHFPSQRVMEWIRR